MSETTPEILANFIPPLKAESGDHCFYWHEGSACYLSIRLGGSTPLIKVFDQAEERLTLLKAQATRSGHLVRVSKDKGQSWQGYIGEDMEIEGIAKAFE